MGNNCYDTVDHTFEPIYNTHSKILILGTMPSVKSREANFYYMNPQNLFWRVLSGILGSLFPRTIDEKRQILIDNGESIYLPSTSPANKKYYSYDKILDEWKKILLYIR